MFDLLRSLAVKLLGETEAEVDKRRRQLADEAASEKVRIAREQQLSHPGIASTPYPSSIRRQAQIIHKLRALAEKSSKAALVDLLALEVAEKSLDSLETAYRRHLKDNDHKGHPATFVEWETLVDKLFALGVNKHTLKQLSKVEIAFFADLMRWKKEDPRHLDEDSPWRAIFKIYAQRTLEVVDWENTPKLSVPGAPPPSKKYGDRYWHYDPRRGWSNGLPKRDRQAPSGDDEEWLDDDEVDEEQTGDELEPHISDSFNTVAAIDDDDIPDFPEIRPNEVRTAPGSNLAAPFVIKSPSVDDDLPSYEELDLDAALRIAEQMIETTPHFISRYWGRTGLLSGTLDPALLIPGLERALKLDEGNSFQRAFLVAARDGRAEPFIANERRRMSTEWALRLKAGDEEIVGKARARDFIR